MFARDQNPSLITTFIDQTAMYRHYKLLNLLGAFTGDIFLNNGDQKIIQESIH